jgi:hypothetical protein
MGTEVSAARLPGLSLRPGPENGLNECSWSEWMLVMHRPMRQYGDSVYTVATTRLAPTRASSTRIIEPMGTARHDPAALVLL